MDKKNVVKKISRSDDFSTSALQNGVFWVTRVSARLSRPYDGNPKPVGSTHSHICTHHLTLQTFVLPNLLIVHQNLKYEKHGELFSLPKCHFRFLSQIDILATNYLCDGENIKYCNVIAMFNDLTVIVKYPYFLKFFLSIYP